MKQVFSLASLLGKGLKKTRLPELGNRELDVLEILWRNEAMTSQATLMQLRGEAISLSTVQSTLERLHRKGMVSRNKAGRSYVYRAKLSRENIISRLMHDIADSFADGDAAPMVSGFLDYLGDDQNMLAARRVKDGRKK